MTFLFPLSDQVEDVLYFKMGAPSVAALKLRNLEWAVRVCPTTLKHGTTP